MEKENQYQKNVSEYEEIDLRDVFNVLIRGKKIIIFARRRDWRRRWSPMPFHPGFIARK